MSLFSDPPTMPQRRRAWRPALFGFAAFAVFGAFTGFFSFQPNAGPVEQPIAFNHGKHVVENEIECATCHVYFSEQTFSGLPETEVCSSCHSEALGQSAEEAKLVRIIKDEKPLVWNRLFRQPPHIFYSHRRHVAVAKLECESCHGTIGKSEAPPGAVRKLTMDSCIDCHKTRGVSTQCTACHR